MEDLWPEDIGKEIDEELPEIILRKQAAVLGQKTNNTIIAELGVETLHNKFNYYFYIVAPTLDDYHFHLFKISHDIIPYPLQMILDDDIATEIQPFPASSNTLIVFSEDEFKELLKKIFNAEKTRRVIGTLKRIINAKTVDYSTYRDNEGGIDTKTEVPF